MPFWEKRTHENLPLNYRPFSKMKSFFTLFSENNDDTMNKKVYIDNPVACLSARKPHLTKTMSHVLDRPSLHSFSLLSLLVILPEIITIDHTNPIIGETQWELNEFQDFEFEFDWQTCGDLQRVLYYIRWCTFGLVLVYFETDVGVRRFGFVSGVVLD